MAEKQRVLTVYQQSFLEHLFSDAKGNAEKAKALAGYAESVKVSEITKSLRDEIIEIAKDILVLNAPKAAMALVDGLDNPTEAGLLNKIKLAESILNRSMPTAEKGVELKVPAGGLFIMPAKEIKEISDGKTIEHQDNEGKEL